MIEITFRKLTFLDKLDKGLIPAKSLNHASMAALERLVAGQKLSFGLICCRFLPGSGNVFSSSFFPKIPLKYCETYWSNLMKMYHYTWKTILTFIIHLIYGHDATVTPYSQERLHEKGAIGRAVSCWCPLLGGLGGIPWKK